MVAEQTTARAGWGPWGPLHELLAQIGERLDQINYAVVRAAGATGAKEPARWRRPGVLGAADLAAVEAAIAAPVVDDLERERAERAARRRQLQRGGSG